MINNNRQQNGRRRGRGGQRQGGGGNQGNGSRIDNRARGNAVQLLEKYKNMAADAQRQGDRVNTEYYLQFADHYFRVVSEQRGRFEEQDRPRRDAQNGFDDDDDFDGDDQDSRDYQPQAQAAQPPRDRDGNRDAGRDQAREQGQEAREPARDTGREAPRETREPRRFEGDRDNRDTRPEREPRAEREPRRERVVRPRSDAPAEGVVAQEGEPVTASEQQPRPTRARAPRRVEAAPADTFDVDRLPPSFAPANDGGDDAVVSEEPKPRRRRLRPASEANQAS